MTISIDSCFEYYGRYRWFNNRNLMVSISDRTGIDSTDVSLLDCEWYRWSGASYMIVSMVKQVLNDTIDV